MNLVGNTVRNLMANQPTLQQFVNEAAQWRLNDLESFVTSWKYSNCKKMFSKQRGQIEGALEALNMEKNSLAYSYLIGFKACEELEDPNDISLLLTQISKFIEIADGNQICIYARPMTDALRFYCNYMRRSGDLRQLIPKLKLCINLLQGSSDGSSSSSSINGNGSNSNNNTLTFAHCELMECCVESLQYNMAFPEILNDIISVQGDGCIESYDNLRYHYYGACIFIALKEYSLALEYLTMVCSAPSEAISVIQIAAYKKYVLVSLIMKQNLSSLPRYTPAILRRYFNKFCSNYTDIANSFNNGKGVVSKIIDKNFEIYQKDGNFGLVKQVLLSLDKHAVSKLTSVYTRLSIERVAALCEFDNSNQAKQILINMIQKGELYATIDSQGVVTFEDAITKSDSQMLKTIHTRIKKIVQLWNTLDESQLNIKQNPEYIKKNLELPGGSEETNGNESMFHAMLGNFA